MADFKQHIPNHPGYTPTPPRNHDLLYAPWMYNPIQAPFPTLSVNDVIGITQASNGSIELTLGDGKTGEASTNHAMMVTTPGILSLPITPGSLSNGSFSAATTSNEAAQAISFIRNDQWITLGVRDTRSQALVGNLGLGETAIFSQASNAISYYRADGSITHQTSSGPSSASIKITPAEIDIFSNVVKAGDASAQPLAYASAITELLAALNPLAASLAAMGATTPPVPVTTAQLGTIGSTLQSALQAVAQYSTTKLSGT